MVFCTGTGIDTGIAYTVVVLVLHWYPVHADCVYVVLKYSTVLVRGTYKVSILDTLPDHSEVVLEFSTVLGDRSTVLGNRSQYSTVQYWYSVQE